MLWFVAGLMMDLFVIWAIGKTFLQIQGVNSVAFRTIVVLFWPFLILMALIMLITDGDKEL
jgi:hypothetical protein